jgi:ABC-type Fe3+ transport system permease subunit
LVSFAALAATLTVTRSQADAARLAGGERHLLRLALRAAFPLAGLAAALAGVLTLADPGPGQIFGWTGAAGELLTSFAARYDRTLATQQAVALAAVAALLAWPLAWKLAPEVAAELLARDVHRPAWRTQPPMTGWLLLAVLFVSLLPIAGLVKPLLAHPWPVARAWREVVRTGGDTLLYAALAAGLAVLVAFALAWSAGGSPARRRWLVTAALALLALPPALPALWLIPWSGRFTLGLALALRGLPLAMLFALRAVGSMPASWTDAARVHRVPRATFLARVVLPWCARWAGPAAALAALLATAEIGTVLLLHPPGHGSLPLAIFTIMANAPEALVAMLCLLYVGLAATAAVAGQPLVRRL